MAVLLLVRFALLLITASLSAGSRDNIVTEIQHSTTSCSVYYLIYGNTVAKEITPQKVEDKRLSEFVQKLLFPDSTSEHCYLILPLGLANLSRIALFLSADGYTPLHILVYWINSKGQQVFQRRLLSIGVVNTFSIHSVCDNNSYQINATVLARNSSFYLYGLNSFFVRNKREINSNLLRILTFNIWNRDSQNKTGAGYARRLERVIEEMHKARADIVGLQEVRFDSRERDVFSPNQIQHLFMGLWEYNYVYQPASLDTSADLTASTVEEGLAILSRYPIISWSYVILHTNRSLDVHQRICLHAEIDTPLEPRLHVFVTHLSLSQELRGKAVGQIVRFMAAHEGSKVLLGDMNSEPDSAEMRYLREAGLTDAWLAFYPEPDIRRPGSDSRREERFHGLTFDATDRYLRKRIDFVYMDLSLSLMASGVELFGSDVREPISDHLGVLLSLLGTQPRKEEL